MEPGEGQFHLRLHAGRTRHLAQRRPVDEVLEQRGLAHARVAAHHEDPALAALNGIDEPVERVAFGTPVRQVRPAAPAPGSHAHDAGLAGTITRPPG
jgi:hypothetical protein